MDKEDDEVNENVMDPQENPTGTGHVPVAGEVGNGPVNYHDPLTQDTDDSVNNDEADLPPFSDETL
jgi:hypothetical protein